MKGRGPPPPSLFSHRQTLGNTNPLPCAQRQAAEQAFALRAIPPAALSQHWKEKPGTSNIQGKSFLAICLSVFVGTMSMEDAKLPQCLCLLVNPFHSLDLLIPLTAIVNKIISNAAPPSCSATKDFKSALNVAGVVFIHYITAL